MATVYYKESSMATVHVCWEGGFLQLYIIGYCMLERVVGSKMASVCREGLVGYV